MTCSSISSARQGKEVKVVGQKDIAGDPATPAKRSSPRRGSCTERMKNVSRCVRDAKNAAKPRDREPESKTAV